MAVQRRLAAILAADVAGYSRLMGEDEEGTLATLTAHLTERFGVGPVHSLQEIERLRELFPKNIRLFTAGLSGTVVAGAVIYESTTTAHVQYIGSSSRGRDVCALDAVFPFLLEEVFVEKPFFDFGISNEDEGKVLNVGLVEQKEGFGGRAIAHDFYEVSL